MAKQRGNAVTREDGDACQREICGGKISQRPDGLMECNQCHFTYNKRYQLQGGRETEGAPPVVVPDYLVMEAAKAHHAMMVEIMDERLPQPEGGTDPAVQWSGLSAEVRQSHYDEAKRALEKWWPSIVHHFETRKAGPLDQFMPNAQANQQSQAAEEMRALLTEIAIPSLQYCEEKFGHDDQARLNLEAGLGIT